MMNKSELKPLFTFYKSKPKIYQHAYADYIKYGNTNVKMFGLVMCKNHWDLTFVEVFHAKFDCVVYIDRSMLLFDLRVKKT